MRVLSERFAGTPGCLALPFVTSKRAPHDKRNLELANGLEPGKVKIIRAWAHEILELGFQGFTDEDFALCNWSDGQIYRTVE